MDREAAPGQFSCGWGAVLVAILPCLPVAAQSPAAPQAEYQPPASCAVDDQLPEGSRKACEQILDSLARFSADGKKLGEAAGRLIDEVSTRSVTVGTATHQRIAIENPLDANDGNEGQKAWEEYSHDSKAILNKTMIGCFEPREVKGQHYNGICQAVCPRRVVVAPGCPECGPVPLPGVPEPIGCRTQDHIVLEYYLPVYQIASNKAGARSLDVNMFNGRDNAPELTRSKTAEHQESVDKKRLVEELERAQIDTSKLSWPDWHKPGEELNLQLNHEGLNVTEAAQSYQIAYQTNLHAQAARDRPEQYWLGYDLEPKSALWCFDEPSKRIVANSMDHGNGIYSMLSRMAELTQVVWPEAYQTTVKLPWNLYQSGQVESLPAEIEPNFRMQQWQRPYADLSRLAVEPGGGSRHKDWIFYGGSLAPFNVSRFNILTDPLRADLFRAATAALIFGATAPEAPGLAEVNRHERRTLRFTKYKARDAGARPNYTSSEREVEDPIIFVDKLQLVYPPLKDADPREASDCFRPESIANNEPGQSGALIKTSDGFLAFPKDLRRQFLENGIEELNRANETRVVVWQKRILCACQLCGRPSGCVTLNDGDFEEDLFAGNGREFNRFPPPFEQLEPFLMAYAQKKSPPQLYPFQEEFPQTPVQSDSGKTGPIIGAPGKGFAVRPSVPTIRPMNVPPFSGPPQPGSPSPPGNKPKNSPVNCQFDVDEEDAEELSEEGAQAFEAQVTTALDQLSDYNSSNSKIGSKIDGTAGNIQSLASQLQTQPNNAKQVVDQILAQLCQLANFIKNEYGDVRPLSQLQGQLNQSLGGGANFLHRKRFRSAQGKRQLRRRRRVSEFNRF